jgi:hypothetical protein
VTPGTAQQHLAAWQGRHWCHQQLQALLLWCLSLLLVVLVLAAEALPKALLQLVQGHCNKLPRWWKCQLRGQLLCRHQ